MDPQVLADELLNLTPAALEVTAVIALADAYAVFATSAEAVAAGVTISSLAVSTGKAAMAAALIGMSVPGNGPTAIEAGVLAFWAVVAAGVATSFVGATAITPPPHPHLKDLLAAQFTINTAGALPQQAATAAIATILYAGAIVGGTVTFPGPVVVPIL